MKPEIRLAFQSAIHGVNMNKTYLNSSFGLRHNVVKNAWSLITGN